MARLNRKQRLRRRHVHIRKRVNGAAGKPRLLVRRSIRHIEASLIDDVAGKTILTVTSKSGNFSTVKKESKTEQASRLGKLLAARAKEMVLRKWSLTVEVILITEESRRLRRMPAKPGSGFRRGGPSGEQGQKGHDIQTGQEAKSIKT